MAVAAFEVDAKEAVKAANKYLRQVYAGANVSDILLEEIDTAKGGAAWLITLSFYRSTTLGIAPGGLGDLFQPINKRQYKVVSVDKKTGRVLSMRMRARVAPVDVERP
jgi:hypothetical protein